MSKHGLTEGQAQLRLVIPAFESCTASRSPGRPAKATTKHRVKKVGEIVCRKIALGVERVPFLIAPLLVLLPRVLPACILVLIAMLPVLAIFIILGTLIQVAQHLVCLVELLELFLCLFVVRVQVGVHLTSQLAVRLFYLFRRRIPIDPQYVVIIYVRHFYLFTRASSIALLKTARSPGTLEVIRLPSTTSASSTQV